MSAENQIRKLNQIPPLAKEEKRKKITTAIVLTLATLISVLFLVYAFVQKLEADKLKEEVIRQHEIAMENEREALKQKEIAEQLMVEAQHQRLLAEQALAACQKSKK